jgi:hypothetical protein
MPEDEIPLDDQGVRNDEIIEILEKIIKDSWQEIVFEERNLTIQERKDVAATLHMVWELARDVMDIDDKLRMMADFFEDQIDLDDEDFPDEELD